ncbi:MAG TPA: phosphatidylserine/phosphatidylglycerophosphate/cardiolipin synthase family protein [Verrucomicrobiae bacterium]|nr:phosphatidylserine/phosphatidylglycerophosphate/cardiolipin synthase family protein [Verrucomicrobiae bacterium]
MPTGPTGGSCEWLCTGQDVFTSMLASIDCSNISVSLEAYIFSSGPIGVRFRDALARAAQRKVKVRVLIDALGSFGLSVDFWKPLMRAGGDLRWFNPISLNRLGFRNHRKLLVCDGKVAFIGGFNIAPEYEGDGVSCGWCDLGVKLEGPLVRELEVSFDEMFSRAGFQHKRFARLLRSTARRIVAIPREQLLLSGPGRGHSPIKRALKRDLKNARSVQIMVAYFLPTWQLRRQLARVVKRGGKVELILAGKSDVAVSRLAAQSLYQRLLRSGVQIYEYQPQVLHAKLIVIDDIVYVGSANLDPRSLNINYELAIRFMNAEVVQQARDVFRKCMAHSRQIVEQEWLRQHSLWRRLKQHWAYFLLVRIDPYIARRQWRALPD